MTRKSKATTNENHLVAYYRVSTQKQGRSGLGLEAQRAAVTAFAESHKLIVIAEVTEVETGKGTDALETRPQLAAALAIAKTKGARLVVAKLDRLSRDVHFISGLMTHHVPFVVAALGPNVDPFMLHIYAAVAEQEAAMTAQRTRVALAAAKARGKQLGNPDMARINKLAADKRRREADTFARSVIDQINDVRISLGHCSSYRAIAREMDRLGVATPTGAAWSDKMVANVMTRIMESV